MIKHVYSVSVSGNEELFESATHAGLAYARAKLGIKPYTEPMQVTMRDDTGAVVCSNYLPQSYKANKLFHATLREMYGNVWNL